MTTLLVCYGVQHFIRLILYVHYHILKKIQNLIPDFSRERERDNPALIANPFSYFLLNATLKSETRSRLLLLLHLEPGNKFEFLE